MSGKKYICELCKKEFKQKSDFQKHSNKKTPCISLNEIQKITQTRESSQSNLSNLTTIFKYCLDVLRDNEHLTGDKALRTLAHLLDLRLLEHQFGTNTYTKTIDIDNYDYDFSDYGFTEEEELEHKTTLLQIVRFSKLAESKEANLSTNMKYLWKDILSVHPKTKNIFLEGKGFDITNQSTYKKLITKLNSFNFESIEEDVLGEAYEEVIKDVMIGKTLGQFFTPPKVKKMMVKLIDPQVKEDGTIEKIFDPAMGTGGFLINCLRHIITQSKVKNINLDWEFIRKFGLGGREAEPDTYQLAVSNMLISSGQMFDEELLQKGDSIRDPITNKYDIILANPPFGIDGLDYTNIEHNLRNEYMPIKSNSAVPLFLQAIIYMLRIGGRCAVVLPEGQELFSKNKALSSVREFLMKTCDLKEVIYLPAGTFTHTSIKTCVFYFVKKRECHEALKIKIKTSKVTNKESDREYNFSKTHQTTKVHFYDYNPDNDVKHLLLEVPIEELSNNSYSLNYAEYLKDTIEDETYEEGIVVKTLGECCNFDIGGTPSRSNNEYYDNGTNLWVSVRELNGGYIYDTTEKITDLGVKKSSVKLFSKGTILFSFKLSIGKTAIVGNPLYTNEAIAGITSKNDTILYNKYLYYYLTINDFTKKGTGMLGNGSLNKKSLAKLKIPIPSLEKQKEIVSYLDFIYEQCNKTSENKIIELKKLNEYCLNNQKVFGDNEIKTLGEVCEFKNGTNITKDKLIIGEYPVVGGGQSPLGYHNIYNVNENTILISKDGAYAGFISKYNKKVFVSNHGIYISNIKENVVNKDYIYYILKILIQQKLYDLQKGTAQPGVNKADIEKLKIPIPLLEKQKEIIKYCEFNHNLIKQLENEIEQNKIQAKLFLSSIVKKVVSTTSDSESNNEDEINSNEDETNIDEDNETNSDEDNESDSEYEYITYKNKEYILEDDNVYNINDDGSKGLIFGTYNNNKVKRIKSEVNIVV